MSGLNIYALAMIMGFLVAMPSHGAQTAGQLIDDSTLATRVKAALASNDVLDALDVNVEVHNGAVQLSGFVGSDEAERSALEAAGKVEGSTSVLDAIVVMAESRTFGQTVDDSTVQTRLKAALADAAGVSEAISINTAVRMGHVLLAGFLPSAEAAERAAEVAGKVEGVTEVHNHIAVP